MSATDPETRLTGREATAAGEADLAYDLILVGAGLANGLIARALRRARPDLRLLILEAGDVPGGNHTWSFHDTDLTPAQQASVAPFVTHRWPAHAVRFPGFSRRLAGGYASIASTQFADVLRRELGGMVRTGAAVVRVSAREVDLAGGRRLRAHAVIDGRGLAAAPAPERVALGYQRFLGQEIRFAAPHGLAEPILMDADVAQHDGYHFVYVLPFGPRTALVEDTYYADDARVQPDELRRRITAYCARQGWQPDRVLREEQGVLPIVLSGDAQAVWDDARGVPRAGLAANLFHPTTGYSLPEAVRLAEHIAALPDLRAPALFAAVRAHALQRWSAQRFFRGLNRMLFLAARPDERWRVMARFYRLPEPLIARFYAGCPTVFDKMRILSGKPPVPVGAALRALRAVRLHEAHAPSRP